MHINKSNIKIDYAPGLAWLGKREGRRVSCFVGNGLLLSVYTGLLRGDLRFRLERHLGVNFCVMQEMRKLKCVNMKHDHERCRVMSTNQMHDYNAMMLFIKRVN